MAKDDNHLDWTTYQGGVVVHANNYNAPTPIVYQTALVSKTVDQTSITSGSLLTWDTEEYDIGGWHDNAINNTRLIVPSGVSIIQVGANVHVDNGAGGEWIEMLILKNGASFIGGPISNIYAGTNYLENINLLSADVNVVPGDYFEVYFIASDNTRNVLADNASWFYIKAIP